MSTNTRQTTREQSSTDKGSTVVELTKRSDGTWEATQAGLDIIGTGNSAARATEDMARQIAESLEADDL